MKILITGGLGHIGSYLLHNINKINLISKIYVIDNFSVNKLNSLSNIKHSKRITLIKENIEDYKVLKNFTKVNLIIHLASIVDAEASLKNPKLVKNHNLKVFKNILNYCIKNKSKLIHISSTSVYGEQSGYLNEDCKSLKPQSPYAEEKVLEENLLKKNKNKLNYVTLRFGTIAGFSSGMRFQTAVNKFCLNALLNKPLTIWKGAMYQTRPYLALSDAFKAISFFINKKIFNNEIYNILTGNFTVREILNIIKKYKKNIKIKLIQSKILNQVSYQISDKKIKSLGLLFSKKTLEHSIKETFVKFNTIK